VPAKVERDDSDAAVAVAAAAAAAPPPKQSVDHGIERPSVKTVSVG
jgi:hypothetical protein